MAMIEGFRIKNYKVLRDVTLGKIWSTQNLLPLTPMTVVIGKNGVGKSSLFDAFGFLADCLRFGVEEACDMRGRGGFERIKSKEQTGPIEFELYFKEDSNARPITYEVAIELDRIGRPFVSKERLRQRRKGQKHGWPFSFLILNEGRGIVWKGETDGKQIDEANHQISIQTLFDQIKSDESREENRDTEEVELEDNRKLGISTLGSLKQH
ncbi:MAG: AAA family ATPase, partial [Chitinivibrionales bacterium]|nr:AAA family ATPase [Chitinivibrionales bacterium]